MGMGFTSADAAPALLPWSSNPDMHPPAVDGMAAVLPPQHDFCLNAAVPPPLLPDAIDANNKHVPRNAQSDDPATHAARRRGGTCPSLRLPDANPELDGPSSSLRAAPTPVIAQTELKSRDLAMAPNRPPSLSSSHNPQPSSRARAPLKNEC